VRGFKLPGGTLQICADRQELSRCLADRFTGLAREAAARRGRFTVALSGGSTPRSLYCLLAEPEYRDRIPWGRTHLFWGDERCVGHDSPESNYKMVRDCLLSRIDIPPENVHPLSGQETDPGRAALEYERSLRKFFGLSGSTPPCFDLILLGLGPDGHTASLFPGTAALSAGDRLVVANYVPRLDSQRITLTLPVLNQAAHVVFMVAGEDKSKILPLVLAADTAAYPAQLVRPAAGILEWYADEPAAGLLPVDKLSPADN